MLFQKGGAKSKLDLYASVQYEITYEKGKPKAMLSSHSPNCLYSVL